MFPSLTYSHLVVTLSLTVATIMKLDVNTKIFLRSNFFFRSSKPNSFDRSYCSLVLFVAFLPVVFFAFAPRNLSNECDDGPTLKDSLVAAFKDRIQTDEKVRPSLLYLFLSYLLLRLLLVSDFFTTLFAVNMLP